MGSTIGELPGGLGCYQCQCPQRAGEISRLTRFDSASQALTRYSSNSDSVPQDNASYRTLGIIRDREGEVATASRRTAVKKVSVSKNDEEYWSRCRLPRVRPLLVETLRSVLEKTTGSG